MIERRPLTEMFSGEGYGLKSVAVKEKIDLDKVSLTREKAGKISSLFGYLCEHGPTEQNLLNKQIGLTTSFWKELREERLFPLFFKKRKLRYRDPIDINGNLIEEIVKHWCFFPEEEKAAIQELRKFLESGGREREGEPFSAPGMMAANIDYSKTRNVGILNSITYLLPESHVAGEPPSDKDLREKNIQRMADRIVDGVMFGESRDKIFVAPKDSAYSTIMTRIYDCCEQASSHWGKNHTLYKSILGLVYAEDSNYGEPYDSFIKKTPKERFEAIYYYIRAREHTAFDPHFYEKPVNYAWDFIDSVPHRIETYDKHKEEILKRVEKALTHEEKRMKALTEMFEEVDMPLRRYNTKLITSN